MNKKGKCMKYMTRLLSLIALVVSLSIAGQVWAQNMAGLVNINTADETALIALDQIGQTKAQAIIKYREEHGAFKAIDDIKAVPGIGNRVFEVIKEKVTVGDAH
jgi:competence protein ComEA